MASWSSSRRRQFGVYLLHKAFLSYLLDPPQPVGLDDLWTPSSIQHSLSFLLPLHMHTVYRFYIISVSFCLKWIFAVPYNFILIFVKSLLTLNVFCIYKKKDKRLESHARITCWVMAKLKLNGKHNKKRGRWSRGSSDLVKSLIDEVSLLQSLPRHLSLLPPHTPPFLTSGNKLLQTVYHLLIRLRQQHTLLAKVN